MTTPVYVEYLVIQLPKNSHYDRYLYEHGFELTYFSTPSNSIVDLHHVTPNNFVKSTHCNLLHP